MSEAVPSRRVTPRSARGVRTRSALVAAARVVFERDGYLDARMSDIAKEAGVAAGSVYTYFDGKEEVFQAVADEVKEEMLHPRLRARTGLTDPVALIDLANREYLLSYAKNARLMALFEQVAQIDETFRAHRAERAQAFAQRNAALIADLQARGLADPSLDPFLTAQALSGMVSRMAYTAFVLQPPVPFDHLAATLTRLWTNALNLRPPGA
ncbi:TetR/AcrR family transcriptional regulator [Actinocorallia sp. API 0066]|uniref:TetR/AcrR family transcriptional regulator n=1 Tax=Actinocorallia sp. API 0066 TaxID=2896846 RepID=UPI001E4B9E71|nr:TetR/AcrR family transcriptional regulator [Actinocorallia sp. API 0066]MCD0452823.1 TetR/AcrR family transcriptional regulator [Actinocorallia sp. API 0066]